MANKQTSRRDFLVDTVKLGGGLLATLFLPSFANASPCHENARKPSSLTKRTVTEEDAKLVARTFCFLPRHRQTTLELFHDPSELGRHVREFVGKNVDFAADFEKNLATANHAADQQVAKAAAAVLKESSSAKTEIPKAVEAVKTAGGPYLCSLEITKEFLQLMLEAGNHPSTKVISSSTLQQDSETYLALLQNHLNTLVLRDQMMSGIPSSFSQDKVDRLPPKKRRSLGQLYLLLSKAESENAHGISQRENAVATLVCQDFRQLYGTPDTEGTLQAFEKNVACLSKELTTLRIELVNKGQYAKDACVLLSFPAAWYGEEMKSVLKLRSK